MHINSEQIKAERRKRAWSQDHLAQVSGLGLRTIQRIETSNNASFESIKSIAASFDIDLIDLIVDEPVETVSRPFSFTPLAALGVVCIALVSISLALVTTQIFADQIMLDVGIALNNETEHEGSLLTKDGKEAEMRLDELLKFVVTPAIEKDGRIFLTTEVHLYENGEYLLISEPKLLTQNNKEAEIRLTLDNGDEVRLQVTPHAD